MAPVSQKTIEHFTHPQHKLVELSAHTEFSCDGCKTPGQGTRYHCSPCDFDLHEYCGTCPRTLKSFMHPHSLTLVQRKSQSTRQNERTCDVCSDPVNGLFYRCLECDFDLHPLCTQLPQELKHAMHQVHHLKLESTLASQCALCGKPCNSWRYRCGVCYFDIHLECVLLTPSPPATKDRGIPTKDQWGAPTSPTHHPMNNHFGNHGFGVPGHLHPPNPWLYGYGMPGHHHQQPYQFQPPQDQWGVPHPPTSPSHHPMNTPFGNHGFGVPGHLHPPNPWLYGYGMPGHHHQQPYQFQPPPPWMYGGYGYGVPYTPPSPNHNNASPHGQEGGSGNGNMGKKMFKIVGRLTMGVLSSAVFGAPLFG